MMGSTGAMGSGMGWVSMALIVVGLAVIVYVAVRLVRRDSTPPSANASEPLSPSNAGSPAQTILEERYARGEIDTEEFTARLRIIQGR